MMDQKLFRLPGPVPEGSLLIGPWRSRLDPADLASAAEIFEDPSVALAWLQAEVAATTKMEPSATTDLTVPS